MTQFLGEFTAKIDDKGRLVFPSAFKGIMSSEDLRFVVRKDVFSDCLEMFPYSEWERRTEELRSRLNFLKKEHASFWREYMRNSMVVEPDSKVGRIGIPRKLLDVIGAEKEVVFFGLGHKIEVWAKEKFDAAGMSQNEYAFLAEKLSDL